MEVCAIPWTLDLTPPPPEAPNVPQLLEVKTFVFQGQILLPLPPTKVFLGKPDYEFCAFG